MAVDGLRAGRLHVVDLERHVRILAVAHELEPARRAAARGAPVAAHQIEGQLTGGRHGHLGARCERRVHVGGVDVLVDAGDVGLAGCGRKGVLLAGKNVGNKQIVDTFSIFCILVLKLLLRKI